MCGKAGAPSPSVGSAPAGFSAEVWHRASWRGAGRPVFSRRTASCFCFETLHPPGTFVPLHIHPKKDEFIDMLEGTLDLQLGDITVQAGPGDLVRMPRGAARLLHNTDARTRALFWVTPAGRLKGPSDQLRADLEDAVRLSPRHGVDFVRQRLPMHIQGACRGRLPDELQVRRMGPQAARQLWVPPRSGR